MRIAYTLGWGYNQADSTVVTSVGGFTRMDCGSTHGIGKLQNRLLAKRKATPASGFWPDVQVQAASARDVVNGGLVQQFLHWEVGGGWVCTGTLRMQPWGD